MQKGQHTPIRPPSFLRVDERAARAMRVITAGAQLPPARKTLYRKWRSEGDKPSPVARVEAMLVELHGCGVSIATLRTIPRLLDALLDDLSTGVAMPTLSLDAFTHEAALEHVENVATLRVASGDESDEAYTQFADAMEAECLHGLELVRAARHKVRTRHLRSA